MEDYEDIPKIWYFFPFEYCMDDREVCFKSFLKYPTFFLGQGLLIFAKGGGKNRRNVNQIIALAIGVIFLF